ncbi:MAG: copper homeostasis protein CutC [Bacteroidetes bacterium]|nr:copper homeostasis protein CutC [Bacteroidota bacterium]MBS1941220.1 copper homeostasis protein CutC [Bacteroidota bacterium]
MLLEVCAYSLASCITAARMGAHRVELCAGADVGGTTPKKETIIAALELGIPVFPMVRPRGGDFLYNSNEQAAIQEGVRLCRALGCPGIVAGVQLADGRLDADAMKRIVELSGPMEVTCHKVFDGIPDAAEGLEVLVGAGCTRVLTSGLAATAMDGAGALHALVTQAAGRITVMPGGGVRSSNIHTLAHTTGAVEFHSSAITARSSGTDADPAEIHSLLMALNGVASAREQ